MSTYISTPFDNRTRLIVNGFLRDIQVLFKLLSNWVDTQTLVIPKEIIDLCISYYMMEMLWNLSAFNKQNSKIIDLSRTDSPSDNKWRIPLNQSITRKMCDTFEIEIKQIKAGRGTAENAFHFGFFKDCLEDKIESGVGVKIKRKEIWCYGDIELPFKGEKVKMLSKNFTKGDRVRMMINWDNDECTFYCNDEELRVTSVDDTDRIFPALCPLWALNAYQITQYSFGCKK